MIAAGVSALTGMLAGENEWAEEIIILAVVLLNPVHLLFINLVTDCFPALALTTLLLEVPFLANAFGFEMISWTEYAIAMGLAFLVIPVVEIVKFIQRKAGK